MHYSKPCFCKPPGIGCLCFRNINGVFKKRGFSICMDFVTWKILEHPGKSWKILEFVCAPALNTVLHASIEHHAQRIACLLRVMFVVGEGMIFRVQVFVVFVAVALRVGAKASSIAAMPGLRAHFDCLSATPWFGLLGVLCRCTAFYVVCIYLSLYLQQYLQFYRFSSSLYPPKISELVAFQIFVLRMLLPYLIASPIGNVSGFARHFY